MTAPASFVGAPCVVCKATLADVRCGHCGATQIAGNFRVIRQIAQTPHSRLYLAEGPDGRRVALKELVYAQVPGAAQVEAFEREASLLKQLDHPRIPKFIASFTEGTGVGTRLYLVQDFVEGDNLLKGLESKRFSERDARDLARQILEILAYLHDLTPRVIHRDVKPANVIKRPDGSIVLVDFGAARDLEGTTTFRATLVGTFGYMPPEQMGGTVDASADVYALGMTLLHLLSRKDPSELAAPGQSVDVAAHVRVSDGFLAWLRKSTALKREERHRDAKEALEALLRPAIVPRTVSGGAFAAAIAGFVVALGAGLFVALRSASPTPPPIAPAPIPPAPRPVAAVVPGPPSGMPGTLPPSRPSNLDRPLIERPETPPPPSRFERVKPVGASMQAFHIVERFEFEDPADSAFPGRCTSAGIALGHVTVEPTQDAALVTLSVFLKNDSSTNCGSARITAEPGSLRGANSVELGASSERSLDVRVEVSPDTTSFRLFFGDSLRGGTMFLVGLEKRTIRSL